MSGRLPDLYEADGPSRPPNTKRYPFFIDSRMNRVIPPWFVECQREEAERKLARECAGRNVLLMRPSSTTGQFALTVQTVRINGRATLNHYSVIHGRDGFYIDIDTSHHAKKTLSEVVELFIRLTISMHYEVYGLRRTSALPASPPTPSTPNQHCPWSPGVSPPGFQPALPGMTKSPAYNLSARLSNPNGVQPSAKPDYLITNYDDDIQLADMMTAVVCPGGNSVLPRQQQQQEASPYLELINDDSASEAAAPAPDAKSPNGDEYLTVSFDDAAETDPAIDDDQPPTTVAPPAPSVDSRSSWSQSSVTRKASSPDYLTPDADDSAPPHPAPPPPPHRKVTAVFSRR